MENLYLIKLVSKWKRAIRKRHTNFLLFYFYDLKLVSIDSALNSASVKLTHSFQKCRRGTKKSNQTWKSSPNITNSNRVFPGKGRGDRYLILTYLDSPMADVFPHHWLIFFNFGHLQEKMDSQRWTKSAKFGSVSFS